MRAAVLASIALCAVAQTWSGVGDRVQHTFLKFDSLPLTASDAVNGGWTPLTNEGDCIAGLGIAYGNGALSESNPVVAYYTAAGLFSGFGVRVFEDLPPSLIPDWYKPVDTKSHEVSVSFRDIDGVCDPGYNPTEPVGDRVVVNQDSTAFNIPLAESDLSDAGFVKGGCIGGMGTHYSYDTMFAPKLAYNASTLMPVTPMYVNGSISAVLISSPKVQEVVPLIGPWEGPFLNAVWCYNWCDDSCSGNFGKDTTWWSSMHFMFHDHNLNTCAAHC